MKITRIYTEDLNWFLRPTIIAIVAKYVDGATFISCQGMWKGEMENSIIIELHNCDKLKGEQIAKLIAIANKQEVVRVVTFDADCVDI